MTNQNITAVVRTSNPISMYETCNKTWKSSEEIRTPYFRLKRIDRNLPSSTIVRLKEAHTNVEFSEE